MQGRILSCPCLWKTSVPRREKPSTRRGEGAPVGTLGRMRGRDGDAFLSIRGKNLPRTLIRHPLRGCHLPPGRGKAFKHALSRCTFLARQRGRTKVRPLPDSVIPPAYAASGASSGEIPRSPPGTRTGRRPGRAQRSSSRAPAPGSSAETAPPEPAPGRPDPP